MKSIEASEEAIKKITIDIISDPTAISSACGDFRLLHHKQQRCYAFVMLCFVLFVS